MLQKARSDILFFVLLVLFIPARTHANSVTVSPTFVRFVVSDKLPQDTSTVFIKNSSTVSVTYEATIADVDTDTGSLVPLETARDITKKTFGVQVTKFSLKPEQSIDLVVTASNSSDLSPGGHYAALAIKQTSVKSAKQASINQIISVGLLLTKEDGSIRKIALSDKSQRSVWFRVPRTEVLRIENAGNVDVVPRGFLSIVNGTSILVKESINDESQPIFPKKSKDYSVTYLHTTMRWPGKYTRIIAYRYEGAQDLTIQKNSVWYLPIWFLALGVAVMIYFAYRLKKKLGTRSVGKEKDKQKSEPLVDKVVTYDVLETIKAREGLAKKKRKTRKKVNERAAKKVKIVS